MDQQQANSHIQLPFQNSHAFIVGINDYAHLSKLTTAINDALVLARRLENHHAYTVHEPMLNADKEELMEYFQETIPQKVGAEDRVLFYFAGHGIALDSEEGPNGYLVPADARPGEKESLIPMSTLHQSMAALPCRHGLLILDCCFAGAFKWASGFRDVLFDLPNVIYEERFWRYTKDPAWQVITSAAYDQKAIDIISNQSLGMRSGDMDEHSPFARALFKALDGEADIIPSGKGNGVITASELYVYLRDLVEDESTEKTKRQTPSLFSLSRHDKGEFIFLSPRHRLNLPPAPNRNPYMGLASYNEEDFNLFFGRGRVVKDLLALGRSQPLLVVRGASGTGKSSVVKAGLLPQLRQQGWDILPVIRPGKQPVQNLEDIPGQLNAEKKQVLVIDQYEELITQCQSAKERAAFEQQLAQWLKAYPKLKIVISIRSDFEPQFKDSPLSTWWEPGRYTVPAFSLEEYREVVVKPTVQEVLFFEPEEMAGQLVEEVSQAPGALPLLSFTLSELYYAYLKSGRQDRALLQADYIRLGGVIGALRTRADAVYEAHDEEHQDSMRRLMLRMVSLAGGELAGQRIYADNLLFSEAAESQRMKKVAEELVNARLIVQSKDSNGRIYLEPAHDALVKAWGRLWEWIKAAGQDKLILKNKLAQALDDYLREKDPKKAKRLLWDNDPRLSLFEAELKNDGKGFNAREEQFIRASVRLRRQKKRLTWSIALTTIVVLAATSVFAFNQMVQNQKQTKVAEQKTEEAEMAQAEAERKQLEAEIRAMAATAGNLPTDKYSQALRLAQLAYSKMTPEVSPAIASLVLGELFYRQFEGPAFSVIAEKEEWRLNDQIPDPSSFKFQAATPDGQCILISYYGPNSQTPRGKLLNNNSQLVADLPGSVDYYSAAFSPNSQLLAAISENTHINLWDVSGKLLKNINQGNAKITALQFSPDSKYLLASSEDGASILWDAEGQLLRIFSGTPEQPLTATFTTHEDYKILTVIPGVATRLYDLQGNLLRDYNKEGSPGPQAVCGPGGKCIFFSGNTARLFYPDSEWPQAEVKTQKTIEEAAFSPSGNFFYLADEEGGHIYNSNGRFQGSINRDNPDGARVEIVRFTPDEKNIITYAIPRHHGGAIVEFRNLRGQTIKTLSNFTYGDAVYVSPSTRLVLGLGLPDHSGLSFLLTFNNDRVWKLGSQEESQKALDAFFLPEKDVLLAYKEEGLIQSWDFTPREVVDMPHTYEVIDAIFINEGNHLFTLSRDPSRDAFLRWGGFQSLYVRLYDRRGTQISEALSGEGIGCIKKCTLLPDGRKALIEYQVSNDYNVWYPFENKMEPAEEGQAKALLSSWSQKYELSAADKENAITSPDGKLSLEISGNKVFLRNNMGEAVGEFSRHTRTVNSAVFSPDGQYVLSASSDGTAKIWPTPARIYQWLSEDAKIPELPEEERQSFGVK